MRGKFVVVLAAVGALVLPASTATAEPVARHAAPAIAQPPPSARAVTSSRVIGHTVKGRPIRAYRMGNPNSARKVVFLGSMHGDETGPSRILLNLIRGRQVKGPDIWVIPYLNRDGVARHSRRNARGVDLNRNFPHNWRRMGGKYYSGRGPASEPETRALLRFLHTIDPAIVVSLHQPLRGIDTSYGKTRRYAYRLSRLLRLPRKVFNCNSGCHGTMTQWFNAKHRGFALTVEYGNRLRRSDVRRIGPTGLLRSVGARR